MGQKINPLGFRIGVSKEHNSYWYAKPSAYSSFIKQDIYIRDFINKNFSDCFVSNISIKRKLHLVNLTVYLFKSNSVFKDNAFQQQIKDLSNLLSLKFNSYISSFNIIEISNSSTSSSLVADSIKQQLEKRVPFRKVIKNAILKSQQAGVKGIKIQVSGRLNGAEIARTEWIREGEVPLHTIRANIDYSISRAQTIFGVIGIKVWLYNK